MWGIPHILREATYTVRGYGLDDFRDQGAITGLADHIDTALWMVIDGLLTEAQDILENEVLETRDRDVADDNDWITSIEGQVLLYPLVLETVDLLENLVE